MATQKHTRIDFINLAGWPIARLDRQGFAKLMVEECLSARSANPKPLSKLFFSLNGQAVSLAQRNCEYGHSLKVADYIHADGQSLVFASKYLSRNPLPERVATTDFFHDAATVAQSIGLRFYILGASEQMNISAVSRTEKLYPGLQISGCRHGYFTKEEELAICREIVESGTDVLWVGLGKPKEQLFCLRNRESLQGVGWIVTCGGLFDFLGGRNKRAPLWMQKAGFEWLHRLLQDPQRFLWRYLTTNIHATYLLWANRNESFRTDS